MGHLLKIKGVDPIVNEHILASTSVPFIFATVQVSNLALTHEKRITVCPSPRNQGGEALSPAGKGLGESQFRRLEKSLALCLLCGKDRSILSYFLGSVRKFVLKEIKLRNLKKTLTFVGRKSTPKPLPEGQINSNIVFFFRG